MFVFEPEREKARRAMGMDVAVDKSLNNFHYSSDGTAYLDFVAQCGAVPLGHNPPELIRFVGEYLDRGSANFSVPLRSEEPAKLARLLCEQIPGNLARCVYTNSGAEATEVAIKLSRSSTKRRRVLSTINGFHGKTYGALCATENESYRRPFFVDNSDFAYVPFNDLDAIESSLQSREYAAFFVEPVQGEGGMIPSEAEYLSEAQKICRAYGTLLVLDEIQTGLGRTGHFVAAEHFQVEADIIMLAKALGGGLMSIGACLTTEDVWTTNFGQLHSSTFAGGALASAVARRVVELLLDDDRELVRRAAARGVYLAVGLDEIQRRYPSVFRATTGMGLMRALHLQPQVGRKGMLLNYLGSPVVSSFIFNRHQICTFLALNRKEVLRLEPALIIEVEHIDRLLVALDDVGEVISSGNFDKLMQYVT